MFLIERYYAFLDDLFYYLAEAFFNAFFFFESLSLAAHMSFCETNF